MLGSSGSARIGVLDLNAVYLPETFLLPQLVGGIIFGVGFALAGLCPGTSCVAAATGRGDGFTVVGGMLSGILITGLAFDRLQSFYNSGARGTFTLPQLLHLPPGLVVCGVVAAALVGFWMTSLIERRSVVAHDTSLPGAASERQPIGSNRLVLAGIAIASAVGAAFVGDPSSASGAVSTTSTPDSIERISAVQLAASIKDRQPGLRVIDVRSPAAFD